MPIRHSNYNNKPFYLINSHFETIIPSMFYKVHGVEYQRERLELADGDFLDLDWIKNRNKRLIIFSHGLEGNTYRHYIKRPAKYFSSKGWDVLAWNNRSCSGEMNRLIRFYHHGATEDISAVVDRALEEGYKEIVLIGFSMGGGMQQKYLGERTVNNRIKGAVSFSVPCHLLDSAKTLRAGFSKFYEERFVNKLKDKLKQKAKVMDIDINGIDEVVNFTQFDARFTLKMFPGFKDQDDFYNKASSLNYLENIEVPLLIINAANDPMLSNRCYPAEIARKKANIYLEIPTYGGHVGFSMLGDSLSYMEYAAEDFIDNMIL